MRPDTTFFGDDLRRTDPSFRPAATVNTSAPAARSIGWAASATDRMCSLLAVRWILDQGSIIALWGARRPHQLASIDDVFG
jgi:aryl-alcohol dehydrogenase-like predicted oxidoreductase